MTLTELHHLGTRLRAAARGALLDYIDGTLPLLISRPEPAPPKKQTSCPVCAKRRDDKAAAQQRWRAKVKA